MIRDKIVFSMADRTVHAIRSKPTPRRKAKGSGPKGRGSDKGQTCGRCGKPHEPKKCPAWGKHVTNAIRKTTSVTVVGQSL